MANYETHNFFCLKCGKAGVPVMRKIGRQHGAFHRKRLYCPWCKVEINHVEVRNQQEKEIFMEGFNNGEFRAEAEDSIRACGNSWIG